MFWLVLALADVGESRIAGHLVLGVTGIPLSLVAFYLPHASLQATVVAAVLGFVQWVAVVAWWSAGHPVKAFRPERPTMKRLAYIICIAISFALFVLCTVAFDMHARATIGGQSYDHALSEHLHYAAEQWVGSIMLLAPFVALAVIAVELAARKGLASAVVAYVLGAVILAVVYYDGYTSSQIAMSQRKWTAASLSIGLLPFKAAAVLVVLAVGALVARAGAQRGSRDSAR